MPRQCALPLAMAEEETIPSEPNGVTITAGVGNASTPGSDGSAAGGGRSDLSEWQRSADEEAALSATKMPGTATGGTPARNDM